LSSDNTQDDRIQDKSYGFVMDLDSSGGPSVGDVGWGLIRVDTINDVSGLNNRVFMVYAAQISNVDTSLSPLVTVSHTYVNTATAWDLKDILSGVGNAASIADRALVALIEAPSSVTFDVSFDASGGFSKTAAQLKGEIQSKLATATVLATFGIAASSDDFYTLTGVATSSPPPANTSFFQSLDFTVLDSFVGPITDWKPLFGDATASASIRTDSTLTQVTAWGGQYVQTRDSGIYYANYVPEPSSLMALTAIGLSGLIWMARRRWKQA
jgi:hypothetical protein